MVSGPTKNGDCGTGPLSSWSEVCVDQYYGSVPQSIGKPTNENAPQLGLVANERLTPVPQSYFLSFVSSPTRGASLPKRWKRWYNWTADIGKREGRNVNKHHMYSSVG